jgi:hypothetical protein
MTRSAVARASPWRRRSFAGSRRSRCATASSARSIISGHIQGSFRSKPLAVDRARPAGTPPSGGFCISGPTGMERAYSDEGLNHKKGGTGELRSEGGRVYYPHRIGRYPNCWNLLRLRRNGYLTRIANLDHSKHSWRHEVFAPRWTSLRASGGVIYFGGNHGD